MKLFFITLLVVQLFSQNIDLKEKPKLFLLNNYTEQSDIVTWQMSEKLDGIRAYWDGEKLISRSGRVFSSPLFFTKEFPKHKLDGELWSKRSDFSNIVSIVNRKKAHEGWKNLTYNIFEVPDAQGGLIKRLQNVEESLYLKVIKQIEVKDKKHLNDFLHSVEAKGGEGVVVRDGSLDYYTGRTKNSLKVKSYKDEECRVVAHNKGQGKYKNILGSLSCKMGNDKLIKIGSGLNRDQRVNPPKIGAIITFKYYGLTSKGNPRFPIFLRERE